MEEAYSFEIIPRQAGGWKLRLIEDGEEIGGGVFPAGNEGYADALQEGQDWLDTRPRTGSFTDGAEP